METWHLTFYPSFWCLRSEQLKILVHSAVFRQHCTKQFFCSITRLLIMLFFAAVNSICLSLNIKVDKYKRCVPTLFKAKHPTFDNRSDTILQISDTIPVVHTGALGVCSVH